MKKTLQLQDMYDMHTMQRKYLLQSNRWFHRISNKNNLMQLHKEKLLNKVVRQDHLVQEINESITLHFYYKQKYVL